MEISDELIERLAVAMHRDHPDLLYLADARLVAATVAEELRLVARLVAEIVTDELSQGQAALQGEDGTRRPV
jgi:hypothetical protein